MNMSSQAKDASKATNSNLDNQRSQSNYEETSSNNRPSEKYRNTDAGSIKISIDKDVNNRRLQEIEQAAASQTNGNIKFKERTSEDNHQHNHRAESIHTLAHSKKEKIKSPHSAFLKYHKHKSEGLKPTLVFHILKGKGLLPEELNMEEFTDLLRDGLEN